MLHDRKYHSCISYAPGFRTVRNITSLSRAGDLYMSDVLELYRDINKVITPEGE